MLSLLVRKEHPDQDVGEALHRQDAHVLANQVVKRCDGPAVLLEVKDLEQPEDDRSGPGGGDKTDQVRKYCHGVNNIEEARSVGDESAPAPVLWIFQRRCTSS